MTLGPVMLDVQALTLDSDDRRRLANPQVGGVILFSRNYQDPEQLRALVAEIRAVADAQILIAVDQEGGRVQRFRNGFQALPAMAQLGQAYDKENAQAIGLAETFGWLMAAELRHYDIDLSFAPILDIGNPISSVIGDRAFHAHPDAISHLANAWIRGMNRAGMEAVGKHFPGHGSVEGDSHHVMPFDRRRFADIAALDLVPFRRVIATHLTAVMMAHVIYEQVDAAAAGYSSKWIKDVLRQQLEFEGAVFSDDLSMNGAESVGGYAERARLALAAGCDMLLVCNNPDGADEVLDSLKGYSNPTSQMRMIRLHGRSPVDFEHLFSSDLWQQSVDDLNQFNRLAGASESGDLFE